MGRYAAFLRGVMPMNCKMPDLKRAFEAAGFTDVKTILASGNVVFSAPKAADATLQNEAEAAMLDALGREFLTMVRPVDALRGLLAADPYKSFRLKPGSKRIVTFLRERAPRGLKLPIEREGLRICAVRGSDVFSAYVRNPKGPLFMKVLQETFGKDQTTRTWDTVAKVAR